MRDILPLDEYRALTIYEDVPTDCKVVMVLHDGFEPHLRIGEFAVVDPSDKAPQPGELFVIRIGSDRPHLRIVQVYVSRYCSDAISWLFALRRPDRMATADTGLKPEYWPEKCLGRVIGIFQPMRTKADQGGAYMRRLDGSYSPPPRRA